MTAELLTLAASLLTAQQEADLMADALALARAIQGEGAGEFAGQRYELARWIAHTAANRWEKEWWRDRPFPERVEHDWHGVERVGEGEVQAWAMRIALGVLQERRTGGPDEARGALFAMTLHDLETHGWLEKAWPLVVNVLTHPDDPLCQFWFLSGFPGEAP